MTWSTLPQGASAALSTERVFAIGGRTKPLGLLSAAPASCWVGGILHGQTEDSPAQSDWSLDGHVTQEGPGESYEVPCDRVPGFVPKLQLPGATSTTVSKACLRIKST